jgi:hypothetical protein
MIGRTPRRYFFILSSDILSPLILSFDILSPDILSPDILSELILLVASLLELQPTTKQDPTTNAPPKANAANNDFMAILLEERPGISGGGNCSSTRPAVRGFA